ncbi:MAG TPA: beta-galactosidase [Chthoniobacterales bacterium]
MTSLDQSNPHGGCQRQSQNPLGSGKPSLRSYTKETATVLCAVLLAGLTGSLLAADLKPVPSGIYDLTYDVAHNADFDLNLNPVIDNPNVDGFRLRISWASIQPDNGDEYDWENLDNAIAAVTAHGKKLCIAIAAGLWTPDWVYTSAPVVYKYAMQEKDPVTRLSLGNQPLPWDTAYQAKWKKFLAAFGARYDSNPALSYVVIGGFMEQFNMYIANIQEDIVGLTNLAKNPPAGYPGLVTPYPDFGTAYTPAAQDMISTYITDFPTTSLILTFTVVFPNDLGLTLANQLLAWGKETYPIHFGVMNSSLFATPSPHDPPPPPLTYIKGYQLVCRAVDNPAWLYQDPDPTPIPPAPQPLQDALETGVSADGIFIEVYEGDLTQDQSQPVLAAERPKLLANVWDGKPPDPPTGLHFVW